MMEVKFELPSVMDFDEVHQKDSETTDTCDAEPQDIVSIEIGWASDTEDIVAISVLTKEHGVVESTFPRDGFIRICKAFFFSLTR